MRNPATGGGTPSGPYGAHLYWKLEIDANNGHSTDTAFTEFRFYDQSSVQITTSGGTAFGGGSGSGGTPGNLFDGNTGTSWDRSSPTNTYVGYQFTSPQAVASIDLYTGTDMTTAPKTCRLRYSDDGSTYTTAFEIWEPSWSGATATRTWPQDTSTHYKALRWNVTSDNGSGFCIMNEAEVHATVGGSDVCNGGATFCSNNAGTGTSPDNLFDNNNSTHFDWLASTQLPGTVGYYFPSTITKPAEYSLREEFGTTNAWKDWTLEWSNDGVTWTNFDTQSGITWASVPLTKTFSVP